MRTEGRATCCAAGGYRPFGFWSPPAVSMVSKWRYRPPSPRPFSPLHDRRSRRCSRSSDQLLRAGRVTPTFARWLVAAACRTATLRPPAKPPARCSPRRLGWASSRSPASTSAIRSCWPAFRILRLSFGFAAIQPCSQEPAVAIVGSRAATDYARQVGERLGSELAGRGIVVTSGLARGVDSAAHAGCLRLGGRYRCRPRLRAGSGLSGGARGSGGKCF